VNALFRVTPVNGDVVDVLVVNATDHNEATGRVLGVMTAAGQEIDKLELLEYVAGAAAFRVFRADTQRYLRP